MKEWEVEGSVTGLHVERVDDRLSWRNTKLQSVPIICLSLVFVSQLPFGNKWWQRRDFRGILLSLVLSSPVGRRSRCATEIFFSRFPTTWRRRSRRLFQNRDTSRKRRVVATKVLSTFSSFLFSIWVKLRYTPREILCHQVWLYVNGLIVWYIFVKFSVDEILSRLGRRNTWVDRRPDIISIPHFMPAVLLAIRFWKSIRVTFCRVEWVGLDLPHELGVEWVCLDLLDEIVGHRKNIFDAIFCLFSFLPPPPRYIVVEEGFAKVNPKRKLTIRRRVYKNLPKRSPTCCSQQFCGKARGGPDQRRIARWFLCRDGVRRFDRHNTVPIGHEKDEKKIAKEC